MHDEEVEPDSEPFRIAYLVSHPIQYQAPLLRRLAAEPMIDLTVLFRSDITTRGFSDPEFGREIAWDTPLLDGYRYKFLPMVGPTDRVDLLYPLNYGIDAELASGEYEFLWVHGYALWFNWLALWRARRRGITTLLRDEATGISRPRAAWKRWAKRRLFSTLDKLVDGVLAIGSLNRAYYAENGIADGKIFDLGYTVDNAHFQTGAAAAVDRRDLLRESLGLEPDAPVILYASKLTRRKRADDLLAAYREIYELGSIEPMPYLLLVGDGDLADELQQEVLTSGLSRVRFLGFRNQSELPALYDLCDVFVLPSENEPWGLVVNEAMSVGRPVIVSDKVGSGADLVRHGETGFVFPVGDRAALRQALEAVLENSEQRARMGKAAAARMCDWDFERNVIDLVAALGELRRRRETPTLTASATKQENNA